jgi:hypothetical protein
MSEGSHHRGTESTEDKMLSLCSSVSSVVMVLKSFVEGALD